MKLIEWMKAEGLNDQAVVDRLNALPGRENDPVSVGAVRKWMYGERIPRAPEMAGLFEISEGQVDANSFYELPTDSPERAVS